MAAPLSLPEIARHLADYQVELPEPGLVRLATYLELLLRWNRRVTLTGLRDPGAIVRRLFGESLYLARLTELRGRLVDIGSGAGFPGLALKLVAPELHVTLIEARQRKCAFLKEVARCCGFAGVEVVNRRFEDWLAGAGGIRADIVTTRAVEVDQPLLEKIATLLAPSGRAAFFTTAELARKIRQQSAGWDWQKEVPVPSQARSRVLIGYPGTSVINVTY